MHVVERTPNEKLYLIVYLLSRAPSTSIRAQSRARSIGEEEHKLCLIFMILLKKFLLKKYIKLLPNCEILYQLNVVTEEWV